MAAGPPPAGWYTQPDGVRRYWDGSRWTGHTAPAQPPRPPAQPQQPRWEQPQFAAQPQPQPPRPAPAPIPPAAGWRPDPSGRPVVSGRVPVEPPAGGAPAQAKGRGKGKVRRQAKKAGVDPKQAAIGGGTLFTEPVLVVNQKPNHVGWKLEYSIFNPRGQRLATVKEQKNRLMVMTLQGQAGEYFSERLRVEGPNGELLLALSRPQKLKSTMKVSAADGTPIGQITIRHRGYFKTLRFDLRAGDEPVGAIVAQESNSILAIQDAAGAEVGRVRRTRDGERREWFDRYNWRNDRDQYVVEILRPLREPLRSLAVAAAIAVDTTYETRGDRWWNSE